MRVEDVFGKLVEFLKLDPSATVKMTNARDAGVVLELWVEPRGAPRFGAMLDVANAAPHYRSLLAASVDGTIAATRDRYGAVLREVEELT